MRRIFLLAACIIASLTSLEAQEDGSGQSGDVSAKKNPVRVSLGGYATWLHMAMFEKPEDLWLSLIHI